MEKVHHVHKSLLPISSLLIIFGALLNNWENQNNRLAHSATFMLCRSELCRDSVQSCPFIRQVVTVLTVAAQYRRIFAKRGLVIRRSNRQIAESE